MGAETGPLTEIEKKYLAEFSGQRTESFKCLVPMAMQLTPAKIESSSGGVPGAISTTTVRTTASHPALPQVISVTPEMQWQTPFAERILDDYSNQFYDVRSLAGSSVSC